MRTLPISADAASALPPSMGSASTTTGAKTTEFFQVLQQWDSGTRPSASPESNRSQDAILSHGSAAETAAGEDEAALPRDSSAGAGNHTFATSSTNLPAVRSAAVGGSQETLNPGNVFSDSVATSTTAQGKAPAAIGGANTMEANDAVLPDSATNALAINIDNTEVLNSGDDPKPGGTKKTDAKQAGANPPTASQRPLKQPSSQAPAHSTATASAANPIQFVPLPPERPASLELAPSSSDPSAPATIPSLRKDLSSQAADDAAIPSAAAGETLPDAVPEAARDAVREVARKVEAQAATEAMTAAAASSALSSAPAFAASFPKPAAEPSPLQPAAKPQAAIASAHAAPNAQAAGGPGVQSPRSSTQPIASPASQRGLAGKIFAKAGSALNHSLPLSEADASSQMTKSGPRDDNASRGGDASAPRQTSSNTQTSPDRNASASLTPGLQAQAASSQSSSALPSAGLHSAGFQSVGFQNAGAQAAAAPSQATATSAPAILPSLPQAPTPASARPQPPPNAAPGPAPMVESGQLQVKGNATELKISVQLPELGKVDVRAVTVHDITTAHLTASHPDALQFLAAGRATLEQALNSRDVVLGTLDSRGQNSQHQNSQNQGQQNSPSSTQSSGGEPSAAATATISVPAESGTAGSLPDYSSISVRA